MRWPYSIILLILNAAIPPNKTKNYSEPEKQTKVTGKVSDTVAVFVIETWNKKEKAICEGCQSLRTTAQNYNVTKYGQLMWSCLPEHQL